MATYNYASGGFPTTPATNDTLIINGTSYLYNGSAWEVVGDSSYTSSATAPTSPSNGDHWFDSTNGVLYVRVDANWVDVSTAGATSGGGGGGGAMELISTQTADGTVSSITWSSIGSFTTLMLFIRAETSSNNATYMRFGVGSVDSGSNYMTGSSSSKTYVYINSIEKHIIAGRSIIQGFSDTKPTLVYTNWNGTDSSTGSLYTAAYDNMHTLSTAQDTLHVYNAFGGNYLSGSTFSLYGIKDS
jgi:hypothetical protein